jgi:tetratricopeptide (TPR) repeat protein
MEISKTANPKTASAAPTLRRRSGLVYEPAIGPRLKILLFIIFAAVALLGATGVYLTAIRVLEWARGQTYTNQFTLGMFMAHEVIGVLIVLPFLVFGFTHLVTARNRPNRVAVRLGIGLFLMSIAAGLTGLALIQLEKLPQLPTGTPARWTVYILHVLTPILAVVLYVMHRRAGPDIKWRWVFAYGSAVGVFVAVMCAFHSQDPRQWSKVGPKDGEKYFQPAKTRTADGNFISAAAFMTDQYCLKCHADVYDQWFHSAHHFSSFNNPPYLFSVRETRKVSKERDGNVRASRWCAGCHDVVPFLSGAFDDPDFDDVNHPTANAGITCVVCHAITNINSPVGNGDYTIEEPIYYPFTFSDNPVLQWLNNQAVKAKPDFHKKTMLKPLHKTAEFCSVCHKVSIPVEVTHYREFQRGQDHYTSYLQSGVSGVGSRSFYYPAEAKTNCSQCHMPLTPSGDFGSKDFDESGVRKVHSHSFPGANNALPSLVMKEPRWQSYEEGLNRQVLKESDYLRGVDPEGKDRKMRIDIFGVKEGGTIDGRLHAPLRPELPKLKPGTTYLVEVVVRTVGMGHPFSQGTVDSNEIWVDFKARSGDQVIGRNGGLSGPGEAGAVDEWSHFVNVLMLDRNGNRINRRNPQDIFTPLYNHQIPPGAGQVVHYALKVPADVKDAVNIKVRLRYRKFDHEYMSLVYKDKGQTPVLPIVDICEDEITLPIEGGAVVAEQTSPIQPAWQRWNDYGIGCYLEGEAGAKKGELRQAEEAFKKLINLPEKAAHAHGYLNLARVLFDEGRLPAAVEALNHAQQADPPAPWWTVAWFNGLVNAQNGHLDDAISDFEKIVGKDQPTDRKFDFGRDFIVLNELGSTLFKRAQQEDDDPGSRDKFLREAVTQFEKTLQIDPEDLEAHYWLAQCFARLGQSSAITTGKAGGTVAFDTLSDLADKFVKEALPLEQRLDAAGKLCDAVTAYGLVPATASQPKLPHLLALIAQCRPLYDQDKPEIRQAAAQVLAHLYRQTHGIYRPDDNARDRTINMYREKHPAAAAASQAVVIYPTNRP